jgi:hypothetical protein
VDEVTLTETFSEYFAFASTFLFHLLLRTHYHLSSWAGTIGQIAADAPSGLSLTAPKENKYNRKEMLVDNSNYGFSLAIQDVSKRALQL